MKPIFVHRLVAVAAALLVCAAPAAAAEVAITGLRFVPTPDQIVTDAPLKQPGIDVSRVPALHTAAFEATLAGILGKPLDDVQIAEITKRTSEWLAAHDNALSLVTVPRQIADLGVIQVLVVKSKASTIAIKGATWFPADDYRALVRQREGAEIDEPTLRADIDAINANPFRRGQFEVSAGPAPGTTDLTIQVEDRFPVDVTASFDNTGTRSTGLDRIGTGVQWGNAFGIGHLLGYDFQADPSFDHFRSHSVSWTAPLPWRDTLSFNANYSEIDGKVPQPFQQTGYSWSLGLRYNHPFAIGATKTNLFAALGFYRSNNTLLFSGTTVSGPLYDIPTAKAGIEASLQDPLGGTNLSLTVTGAVAGLTGNDTDAAYQATRAAAHATFTHLDLTAERITRMPFDITLDNALTARLASTNLLGPEQVGFAGMYGVRGYRQGTFYADEGLLLRSELRAPAFGLTKLIGSQKDLGDQIQFLVFVDYAHAINVHPVGGFAEKDLVGVGPGVRFTLGRNLSARGDLGFGLTRDDERALPTTGFFSITAVF